MKGGEVTREKIPIFLPDVPYLPEYSSGRNLRKNFDDMSDILYSKDIPDDVKIKLYHIFRDKYEDVRKPQKIKTDPDDPLDNENGDSGETRILERILARLPENKQELGNTVGDILFNEDGIKWSKFGHITSPATPKDQMDLGKLIKVMIYSNTGTKKDVKLVYSIIKPIFNILKPYILNKKLNQLHSAISNNRRMSQYVPW